RRLPWTKGFDVIDVVHVDLARGELFASGCDDGRGISKYLYRVAQGKTSIVGGPQTEIFAGWHEYQVSTDGSLAIHTFSNFDGPPEIDLVRLSAERVRVLVDNKRLRERYDAITKGKNEFFQVDIGEGVNRDGRV